MNHGVLTLPACTALRTRVNKATLFGFLISPLKTCQRVRIPPEIHIRGLVPDALKNISFSPESKYGQKETRQNNLDSRRGHLCRRDDNSQGEIRIQGPEAYGLPLSHCIDQSRLYFSWWRWAF